MPSTHSWLTKTFNHLKNGEHVFVSSANFTEAAQERNIEVGLLVQSRAVADRVCRFFDALLDIGYFVRTI
jgi:phosphatidylserine/phosphatidylglycerophosphate/cardiolipin synthase-like enzyme